MSIELLLLGGIITLINSLLVLSINRTLAKKEKLEEEKELRLEKVIEEMVRRIEVSLKRQDKIVEILSYIIYEHRKNHGDSEYISDLLEHIRD
ncbi:MAG: hypothetical protein N2505_05930 [Endomicrobia bacterium]|nr:hypothetical protein [Endomicrobiia bacterium]